MNNENSNGKIGRLTFKRQKVWSQLIVPTATAFVEIRSSIQDRNPRRIVIEAASIELEKINQQRSKDRFILSSPL